MASYKTEIKKLVDKTISGTLNEQLIVSLGKLSKSEASKIKLKTGKEVTGFERVIDNYAVKHTLKNHGNSIKEQQRGQIAIQPDDFKLIPDIVQTENIIYSGKNRIGNDVILYEKRIGHIYFYAEEIPEQAQATGLKFTLEEEGKEIAGIASECMPALASYL